MTAPVDWFSPTWGNVVHFGITTDDAHTVSEDAAEADQ